MQAYFAPEKVVASLLVHLHFIIIEPLTQLFLQMPPSKTHFVIERGFLLPKIIFAVLAFFSKFDNCSVEFFESYKHLLLGIV